MGDKKGMVISKQGPMSKIEKAGEQVVEHIIELARTTDLTHAGIAKRINEVYGLSINKKNVEHFFRSNANITRKYLQNKRSLAILRVKLTMDYREQLVTDIKDLNEGIDSLKGNEGDLLESDKKWKGIGDLIDKKGKLLLRAARLSGKIIEKGNSNTQIDKMQVNIVQQISEEKSEIIRKLKNFDPEKVIDVETEDVKDNNEN